MQNMVNIEDEDCYFTKNILYLQFMDLRFDALKNFVEINNSVCLNHKYITTIRSIYSIMNNFMVKIFSNQNL